MGGEYILLIHNDVQGCEDLEACPRVKRAIDERRELVLAYWSTSDVDVPRQHRVAPYNIFFRPEGHAYLDATLLHATPARGESLHAAIDTG